MREISISELEALIRRRLLSISPGASFSVHRLKQKEKSECNWCLLSGMIDHLRQGDLKALQDSERALEAMKMELQEYYNLPANQPSEPP